MKKTAILYITDNGRDLAERLKELFAGATVGKFHSGSVESAWRENDMLVFIMASGIVVRTIAPLLRDKKSDPGVVVLDEGGKYVISLVSGHLGGANDAAGRVARFLGGQAVITTASDVNNLPSIDLWARDNGLIIENWELLPQVGTRYVNNAALRVYSDMPLEFPEEFLRVADPRFADVIITNRRDVYADAPRCGIIGEACSTGACRVKGQVYIRPVNLVAGIGCNSGTSQEEIENAVRQTLEAHNLVFASLHSAATIDIKGNEPGLRGFVEKNNFPLRIFSAEDLNAVPGIERSDAAFRATGAYGVAEPAALLAAGADALIVPKQRKGNVTVAVALKTVRSKENSKPVRSEEFGVRSKEDQSKAARGKIYVVGTGPGSLEHITPAARAAIAKADVIVGYGTYLDLIGELLANKEVVSTGMTQEVDRCRKAVELSADGRTVAVISGGDPGVYAMAGLVFETLRGAECGVRNAECNACDSERSLPSNDLIGGTPNSQLSVEVIPGISALNAAASRLGAPLMHDFACISLSDRLTPWEAIERRLEAAAAADFVIVLYNPRSRGRAGHLGRAREIVLKHRAPGTAVGIVKGAMRENEKIVLTDLKSMPEDEVDMQTTVIIGNSKTFVWNHLMITPRGYENKKDRR